MFFSQGQTCPVCHRPFTEKDDIVTCPDCGLSHHRTCWIEYGRCSNSERHGMPPEEPAPAQQTASQSRYTVCARCGQHNPEFAEFCQHCGAPLKSNEWDTDSTSRSYSEYKPFGTAYSPTRPTMNDREEIGEHTVGEYAAVVGARANYYIPRFKEDERTGKCGWNWAAFLLTPYWFMYRKMVKCGIFLFILNIIQSILLNFALMRIQATTTDELLRFMETLTPESPEFLFFLAFWFFSVIMLVLRFVFALFGNKIYKQHCDKLISKAKESTPDISVSELAIRGGTSFGLAIVGYIALYMVTQIIMLFF